MSRSCLGLVGWIAVGLAMSTDAMAQRWSPDGRWVAYALEPSGRGHAPRLLLRGTRPETTESEAESEPEAEAVSVGYRLWATRVEGDGARLESVRLAAESGPICQPGWNHDGSAIAYARLARKSVDDPEGPVEGQAWDLLEVVVQSRPEGGRLAFSTAIPPADAEAARGFHQRPIAWSADSGFLAVPIPGRSGLLVVRLEDGRVVRRIADADGAAWSPWGARLAYGRGGEEPGLYLLDCLTDESRRLADGVMQDRLPAPVWIADGVTLLRMAYRPQNARADDRDGPRGNLGNGNARSPLVFELVPTGGGQGRMLREVSVPPFDRLDDRVGLSMAIAPDGQRLFYAAGVEGHGAVVSWVMIHQEVVRKRFNPFFPTATLLDLSASPRPGEDWLAFRVGPSDRPTPPAICDPNREQLIPLAPDPDSRAAWSSAVIDQIGVVVLDPEGLGEVIPLDLPEGRPTPLPSPGEIPEGDLANVYLKRLTGFGLALTDDDPTAVADVATAEARLIYRYESGDYPAALRALDAFESAATTRDDRRRLLGLRAQIFTGLGNQPAAAGILDELLADEPIAGSRLEEGPTGPTRLVDPAPSWSKSLRDRLTLDTPK